MKNDNARNPDSNSIMTDRDLKAAIEAVNNSPADLLEPFPVLRQFIGQLCDAALMELILNGVPVDLSKRAAGRMYLVATVGALAVRHACLGGLLPEGEADAA
jgi:hypothetical protein